MDSSFYHHWGSLELARNGGRDPRYWSPADQLHAAWHAYTHIGYSPWPNTAAMCGLR